MVTVPVLSVAPAAIVNRAFELSVMSVDCAGSTGVTVIRAMVAWAVTPLSDAVTVLTPPFSPIVAGVRASVRVGRPSSSSIVSRRALGAATPLPPETICPSTRTSLFPSVGSSTAVMVTTPVLSFAPAAMVSIGSALSVK